MNNYERIRATVTEVQAMMQRLLDAGVPLEQVLYEGWRTILIAVKEILPQEKVGGSIERFEQLISRRWAFQLAVAGLKGQPEPKLPGSYWKRLREYNRPYVVSMTICPEPYDSEQEDAEITKMVNDHILKETRKTARVLLDAGISFEHVLEEGKRIIGELLGQEPNTSGATAEDLFQQLEGRLKRAMNTTKRRHARENAE